MADVKWIKITTDIFDDEKMKIIDTMPARDEIIVIWFKLLSLAGKVNQDGLLVMNNNISYTPEMLTAIFNRKLNTVKLALSTFEGFGMIDIEDGETIGISNWNKHQNIEGMEKIREQNRLRKRKERENKNQKAISHVTSRDSHATDKNRIDKEKKENINKYNPSDDLGYFLDEDFQIAWKELMISRTKLKCSKSDLAIKKLIGKVNDLSTNKQHAIFIIEEAIVRGWKSLFPIEYKEQENKLEKSNCKTHEEWRYYNYLDIAKDDLNNPDNIKRIAELKKEMEESFK